MEGVVELHHMQTTETRNMNEHLLNSLRHACRAAPTAALATGFVCPVALAGPGDLDPGFADIGRYVAPNDLIGIAQTVELSLIHI